MPKYFTYQESVDTQQALNQMDQAITARLLHFNGHEGKAGTQWKTDPLKKLVTSFAGHAWQVRSDVGDQDQEAGLVASEEELVDALAMGMMLFDRIQMLKAEKYG